MNSIDHYYNNYYTTVHDMSGNSKVLRESLYQSFRANKFWSFIYSTMNKIHYYTNNYYYTVHGVEKSGKTRCRSSVKPENSSSFKYPL